MEMNIGPIKQMMENMGITEDDYEAMSEQFGAMMGMGGNFNNRENAQPREPRENGAMPEGFRPGRQNQNGIRS